MKRVLYLSLFFMCGLFLFPFHVQALTGSIEVSCDKENYGYEETATCTIKGNSSEEIKEIQASVWKDGIDDYNFEFIPSSDFEGSISAGTINLQAKESVKGDFTLGTLTIEVKDKTCSSESCDKVMSGPLFDEVIFVDSQDGNNEISTMNSINLMFSTLTNSSDTQTDIDEGSNNNGNIDTSKGATEQTNPNTSDKNIVMYIGLLILVSIGIAFSYRKLKKLQ